METSCWLMPETASDKKQAMPPIQPTDEATCIVRTSLRTLAVMITLVHVAERTPATYNAMGYYDGNSQDEDAQNDAKDLHPAGRARG